MARQEAERRAAERRRQEIERTAELVRERSKRSLSDFIRLAWHVLEPEQPFVYGWHIDAIAEHLEAVTAGQITRLLINIPPGTMKSLAASVLWPAWEWGPAGRPSLRYLSTSYTDTYVKRDSRRMRDLVSSEWYQAHWPVALIRAGERSFENTARGSREGVAFASMTSGRGDRVIIDDPHSTETAESDTERERALRIFRESVPTRLNDPARSAIVVIMQRLHEKDISGEIVSRRLEYDHLMLPMEAELDRRCRTSVGFIDPRDREGELLFPERFPRPVVDKLKATMGEFAVAGQLQQRPSPRAGGLFKREWFGPECFIPEAPKGCRWVRHWDLAASTRKSSARTAAVKMGKAPDGSFVVADVKIMQEEGHVVRSVIRAVAETDGRQVVISLPQDPGQAGKVQAKDFITGLAGFSVTAEPETGDKFTRAEPFAAQCAVGNVKMVRAPWNEAYIDELCGFPTAAWKDQVDASSGAFGRLTSRVGSFGTAIARV